MGIVNSNISNITSASSLIRTGVILPKKHPTDPNLYYVGFGEKTNNPMGKIETGVWCSNGISTFTRYRDANNVPVSYGSYTPLQPNSPVNVLMANGGIGASTIIGFPPTNTSYPNSEDRDTLHILGQTPNGSVIQMDDKTGSINIMYNKGETVLSLSDNIIEMGILEGAAGSSKESHTSISMRKNSIKFKLKDAMMQFDETGLSVSFDDGGTSMNITKNGVVFEGMDVFKVASNEQVSLKGTKLNIEGTKTASLSANELKVGGKTLTNITGAQINVESMYGTTLKSTALNFWALAKIDIKAATRSSNISGMDVTTATVIAEGSSAHAIKTGSFGLAAGVIGMDSNISTNSGMGKAIANGTYSSAKLASSTIQIGLTTLGTSMLLQTSSVAIINKIIADTLAGTSEPAQEPSGSASGAKDKNDKKSFNSVAATKFNKNNHVMEKYSVVPNLAVLTANASPEVQINAQKNQNNYIDVGDDLDYGYGSYKSSNNELPQNAQNIINNIKKTRV